MAVRESRILQSKAKRDGNLIRALLDLPKTFPDRPSVCPELNKTGTLKVINNDKHIISIHSLHKKPAAPM